MSIFGLLLSKSSFAVVSAGIAGLIYTWFVSRKMAIIFILIALIIIPIFFTKFEKLGVWDFGTRLGVWRYGIKSTIKGRIILEKDNKMIQLGANPVFGYGFGSWLRFFPYVPQQNDPPFSFNYADEKFTHAHNDFVELFFELGYLGLISMFLLMGDFIKKFIKAHKDKEMVLYFSCLIAYLLNSMGNFLSQLAVSGMFLIIFYGFYEGRKRELNGQTS